MTVFLAIYTTSRTDQEIVLGIMAAPSYDSFRKSRWLPARCHFSVIHCGHRIRLAYPVAQDDREIRCLDDDAAVAVCVYTSDPYRRGRTRAISRGRGIQHFRSDFFSYSITMTILRRP